MLAALDDACPLPNHLLCRIAGQTLKSWIDVLDNGIAIRDHHTLIGLLHRYSKALYLFTRMALLGHILNRAKHTHGLPLRIKMDHTHCVDGVFLAIRMHHPIVAIVWYMPADRLLHSLLNPLPVLEMDQLQKRVVIAAKIVRLKAKNMIRLLRA